MEAVDPFSVEYLSDGQSLFATVCYLLPAPEHLRKDQAMSTEGHVVPKSWAELFLKCHA